MFKEGDYVRMKLGPNAQQGTIHLAVNHGGRSQFLFRLDPRFEEKLPDFFVSEGDIEACARPTDDQVFAINALIRDRQRFD
jgi:hypothetical protein